MQYIVVLEFSLKYTHPYPNTLPIRSLSKVINFWVFHHRDLTLFLIHLSRTFHFSFLFSFHFCLFEVFSFSFPFHTTISSIFFFYFSSQNHDAYGLQSNHILTFTISQNITPFTLIMFHNLQQSTQQFFFTLITTNIKENS